MSDLKTKQNGNASHDVMWSCMTRVFSLADDEASAVRASAGPVESGAPGAELIAGGAHSGPPRILLHGWAAEQRVLSDGRRQILRFVLPGDIFGLKSKHHASVPAVTAISAVTFAPMHLMGASAEEEGSVFARIADTLSAETIQGLRNHVVRLGRLSAYERVAHLMLELYFRLDRVGLTDGPVFEMPLSQDVLADAVGLSTVHTNRVLQKLRGEGLLETRRNLYSLPNLERLAEVADYGTAGQPDRFAPIVLAR